MKCWLLSAQAVHCFRILSFNIGHRNNKLSRVHLQMLIKRQHDDVKMMSRSFTFHRRRRLHIRSLRCATLAFRVRLDLKDILNLTGPTMHMLLNLSHPREY